MKTTLLAAFLLSGLFLKAQTTKKFYDWQWAPCTADKARFLALTDQTDSGWLRRDFYLATNKLQMRGLYKDSACKIRNGWFRYYFSNANLSSEGNFINGKKDGVWISYYYNQMMRDSAFYQAGELKGIRMSWHINGYPSDSSVYNNDGSAVHVRWFDNGSLSSAGRSRNEKIYGRWQFYHRNGNLAALEVYQDDELASRIYYDEAGKQLTDTSNNDRDAEFKGGNNKWRSFMLNNLQFPKGVELVNTDIITVVVAAKIDEEGNVADVYVDIPFNTLFDDEAVRIMKKSPKWVPAISHNRKVSFYIRQPISFQQLE